MIDIAHIRKLILYLVLKKRWMTASVISDTEIFGLWPQLFDDGIIKFCHSSEKHRQLRIIEGLFLVLSGQLFAHAESAFPHFSLVEIIDHIVVQSLFQFPVGLAERISNKV